MKILNTLLFGLVSFAASAQSAEIVPQGPFACTLDINPWNHPSRCVCPQPARYDQRLGSCIVGDYESIMFSGAIVAELAGVGGETTGIAIQSFTEPKVVYELVLKQVDYVKLSKLDGLPFEIEGDLIELPGVETGPRPAIIARRISWLD